jgi:hypothetical protein
MNERLEGVTAGSRITMEQPDVGHVTSDMGHEVADRGMNGNLGGDGLDPPDHDDRDDRVILGGHGGQAVRQLRTAHRQYGGDHP